MVICTGYESLLEAVRVSELSLLYGFFARFKDGLPLMSKAFSDYIKVHMQYMYTYIHMDPYIWNWYIHMCIYQFIGGNYKTVGNCKTVGLQIL